MTTLLVASGGGHLRQMAELAPRLRGVDPDFVWVTWESPQSRSLLAGENVVFVRPTAPRDVIGVARNLDFAARLWLRDGASALVTTGAQLVLPFLVVGRALGRPCHFIESAARSEGPSLSGKTARYIPGTSLYTQYSVWSDTQWTCVGSVFDGFEVLPRDAQAHSTVTKVLVTLGTIPRWQFTRLIEACLRVIPEGAAVTWQTGSTDTSDFNIDARQSMTGAELEQATREADVVISHAGVGSALTTLRCGKRPILVVREAAHSEHVDDHQRQIATELEFRNLALVRSPATLSTEDLIEVSQVGVMRAGTLPPIELDRSPRALHQFWRRRVQPREAQ